MGIDTSFDELQRMVHTHNVACSDGLLALLELHHGGPQREPKATEPTIQDEIEEEPIKEIQVQPAPRPRPFIITNRIEQIKRVVCQHFGVSREEIESATRIQKVVLPRQIALFLARDVSNFSFPEIGRRFGGRDHTTVLHAYRKIEGLIRTDSELAASVEKIKAAL